MSLIEKIILFPLPEYVQIFDDKSILIQKPFCICYQYNIEKGNGPYGFNTEKSERLVNSVFSNIKYWDKEKFKLTERKLKIDKGICFYNENECLIDLQKDVDSYLIMSKKNEYLKKMYGKVFNSERTPILLEIYDNCNFVKSDTINKLIERNCHFFIQQTYSPEAGISYILFDEYIQKKIEKIAREEQIEFKILDSLDQMNPW